MVRKKKKRMKKKYRMNVIFQIYILLNCYFQDCGNLVYNIVTERYISLTNQFCLSSQNQISFNSSLLNCISFLFFYFIIIFFNWIARMYIVSFFLMSTRITFPQNLGRHFSP